MLRVASSVADQSAVQRRQRALGHDADERDDCTAMWLSLTVCSQHGWIASDCRIGGEACCVSLSVSPRPTRFITTRTMRGTLAEFSPEGTNVCR